MEELPNLLTQGGVTIVVMILLGILKITLPAFDLGRFGPVIAIVLGIGLVALANLGLPSDVVGLQPVEVLLTGLLGGGAAVGIYSAARGNSPSLGTPG